MERNKAFHWEGNGYNLMTVDQHEWARRKIEGSLKEYARGIQQKATLEWAIGEVNSAIQYMWLSPEEVKGIIMKVELDASDDQRRIRLTRLRERLYL